MKPLSAFDLWPHSSSMRSWLTQPWTTQDSKYLQTKLPSAFQPFTSPHHYPRPRYQFAKSETIYRPSFRYSFSSDCSLACVGHCNQSWLGFQKIEPAPRSTVQEWARLFLAFPCSEDLALGNLWPRSARSVPSNKHRICLCVSTNILCDAWSTYIFCQGTVLAFQIVYTNSLASDQERRA
mgnify:CR=1 FL=1